MELQLKWLCATLRNPCLVRESLGSIERPTEMERESTIVMALGGDVAASMEEKGAYGCLLPSSQLVFQGKS